MSNTFIVNRFYYLLALPICPFLAIGILQIIDSNRIPIFPDSKQKRGSETIFGHDNEIDKKSSGSLDHANLSISHGDQSFIDKFICKINEKKKIKIRIILTKSTIFIEFIFPNNKYWKNTYQ